MEVNCLDYYKIKSFSIWQNLFASLNRGGGGEASLNGFQRLSSVFVMHQGSREVARVVCLSALEYVISTAQNAAQGTNITSVVLLFWCLYCTHTHICHLIHTDLFTIVNLRTCEVAIKYWGHIFFSCSRILLLLAWVGYVTMIVSFDALRVCS